MKHTLVILVGAPPCSEICSKFGADFDMIRNCVACKHTHVFVLNYLLDFRKIIAVRLLNVSHMVTSCTRREWYRMKGDITSFAGMFS